MKMLVYDVKLNFESAHMLLIVVLYFFSCQIRAWCRESSWIYERVQKNKWWFKLLEHTIEYFAIDFGYTIFTFSCLHIIPSLLEQLLHSCVIRCCVFPIPLHPFNHSFIYVINIWSKSSYYSCMTGITLHLHFWGISTYTSNTYFRQTFLSFC